MKKSEIAVPPTVCFAAAAAEFGAKAGKFRHYCAEKAANSPVFLPFFNAAGLKLGLLIQLISSLDLTVSSGTAPSPPIAVPLFCGEMLPRYDHSFLASDVRFPFKYIEVCVRGRTSLDQVPHQG